MTAQAVIVAIVAIVEADTTLRTLFGRTSNLVVPFEGQQVNPTLPVVAYAQVNKGLDQPTGYDFIDLQFSCFANASATAMQTCNTATERLAALLTLPAFAARSVDACPNPSRLPLYVWPPAEAEPPDTAFARADVTLSFLI